MLHMIYDFTTPHIINHFEKVAMMNLVFIIFFFCLVFSDDL